jgi:hypothetical protein
MKYISQFARFWFDFIVGDDWRLAVGVVAVLMVVHWVIPARFGTWWMLPLAIAALLAVSIRAAAAKAAAGRGA